MSSSQVITQASVKGEISLRPYCHSSYCKNYLFHAIVMVSSVLVVSLCLDVSCARTNHNAPRQPDMTSEYIMAHKLSEIDGSQCTR